MTDESTVTVETPAATPTREGNARIEEGFIGIRLRDWWTRCAYIQLVGLNYAIYDTSCLTFSPGPPHL